MQRRDRIAKRGKPLACDPAWVLPLRQIGHTGERSHHSLAHNIKAQALGERIDRLYEGDFGQILLAENAIGMNHLEHPAIELEDARNVTPLSDRKQVLEG